jgi:hypothetical protein
MVAVAVLAALMRFLISAWKTAVAAPLSAAEDQAPS